MGSAVIIDGTGTTTFTGTWIFGTLHRLRGFHTECSYQQTTDYLSYAASWKNKRGEQGHPPVKTESCQFFVIAGTRPSFGTGGPHNYL